jgi:hypothetical protein
MYRACSTWQYEVIAHLLERHRDGRRLGYVTGEEFAERGDRDRSEGGWNVLKSHEGSRSFAEAVARGRATVFYAHRDVRDVVFSLMHKRGASFEQLVRQGMIHQVLVNDRFWSRQPGVLVQRYERLIADPIGGVVQIAAHLGIALSPGEAAEVSAEYSFQTNRRRTMELVERLRAEGVDLTDPSNLQYYDQRTLLHWNHLREGRPGNWRTEATPRQRAVLARLCDEWLVAHGYEADTIEPTSRAGIDPGEAIRRELGLARGRVACTLRCASLRYPRAARAIKPLLGIAPDRPTAVPARAQTQVRVDPSQAATLSSSRAEPLRHGAGAGS